MFSYEQRIKAVKLLIKYDNDFFTFLLYHLHTPPYVPLKSTVVQTFKCFARQRSYWDGKS